MIESNRRYDKYLKYLLAAFIIIAVAVSVQKLFQGERSFWGHTQSSYNNYVIFKMSFRHLIDHVNLYDLYEKEYGDFYKYSPTFAVFMAPFYFLPDWAGLTLWNLLNCLLLYYGIVKLPELNSKIKVFILGFSLLEMITSLQNQQSNAMITGLLLFAFVFFEKRKIALATLLIIFCFFVKLTGVLACVLFLFYDKKPKFILWSCVWFVVFACLPLMFMKVNDLFLQYQNWIKLLTDDHSQSYGISVFGIIKSWFGVEPNKMIVLLAGVFLFLLPVVKLNRYKQYDFRLMYLCSLLIWIVIFNHKAESSSYIVAIAGCATWYFMQEKNLLNTILIVLAFVLISLSPTDVFPKVVRENFIVPFVLKALPAIIIWLKIETDLIFGKPRLKFD